MNRLNNITETKSVGRPVGVTGKYRDSNGKPIGVMEWRRLHPEWRKAEPSYRVKHQHTKELLELIVRLSNKPRDVILSEALELYLKEKLK